MKHYLKFITEKGLLQEWNAYYLSILKEKKKEYNKKQYSKKK